MKHVLVLGAGGMGTGITQLLLVAGHEVHLFDLDAAALFAAQNVLLKRLQRELEEGRMAEPVSDVLGRLLPGTEPGSTNVAVAIEAVPERRDAKRSALTALLERTPAATTVATTTLAMPVASLVDAERAAGRVLGFHFMNPAPALRLCELVVPAHADAPRVPVARAFLEGLGLTVVTAPDQAGFILNRTHLPFLLGAIRRVEEGISPVDVDTAFVTGCRHPMGPLAIVDLVGLDVTLAISETLFDETGAEWFRAPELLRRKVASGELGRKAGRGFFIH